MCIRDRYHTFSPKHVKPLSLVLRGLDVESPLEEILDELRELGYPVRAVRRVFTPAGPRRPIPLVRILVENSEAGTSLLLSLIHI